MKKIYNLLLLGFLFVSLSQDVKAQLPANSIAPDFTATDINGVEHNLYDLLNEGKTVVLDIFATWCGPCWDYHTGHALADFYAEFGPDGSDEVYVFGIEGDGSTNLDCITGPAGCNSSTYGDWTEGVPYPIIDNAQIASAFGISFFPTIYMIYPNRLTNVVGQLPSNQLANLRNNYEPLGSGINPTVLKYSGFNGGICNDLWPVAPNYTVSNYGDVTINSCDIKVLQNGEVIYEEAWAGEAASYDVLTEIAVPTVIATENIEFELVVDNINGADEGTLNYKTGVTLNVNDEIHIKVKTDDFADVHENGAAIFDEAGDLVYTLDLSQPNTYYDETVVLDAKGCYIFKIYDSGEDGINGEVSVFDGNGWYLVRESAPGAEFGTKMNVTALLSGTTDLLTDVSLELSPNPVFDKLNVSVSGTIGQDYKLSVINHLGQVLNQNQISLSNSSSTTILDVTNFGAGIYFMNLSSEKGTLTKKFVVK